MPERPYEYAIIRVVPDVERGEAINVGVIVYAPQDDYLACKIELPRACLRTFAPGLDVDTLQRHLEAIGKVCQGDSLGGPIAALPLRERFHWLAHPRSAVLAVSDVHAGSSPDLDGALTSLFERLVGGRS